MASAALAVAGEFTVFTVREVHERMLAALADDFDGIELDLSGVSEMDCAGVQLLLSAEREAAECGKALAVLRPSAVAAALLALCELSERFGVPPESTR